MAITAFKKAKEFDKTIDVIYFKKGFIFWK